MTFGGFVSCQVVGRRVAIGEAGKWRGRRDWRFVDVVRLLRCFFHALDGLELNGCSLSMLYKG